MFGVVLGVGPSPFSGELSGDELADEFDTRDLFPKLEMFPDSSCSSVSLSEFLVKSSSEMDAIWLLSFSSSASTVSSLLTVATSSGDCKLGVWSTFLDFPEVVVSLLSWLSFCRRRGEAEAGETKHFIGDKVSSVVRSTITFSFEGSGRLRLKKQSSGPRPLTKGGPPCRGSVEESWTSETPGSGEACSQRRLGSWFSLGSGFRRLNGRRAADKKNWKSYVNGNVIFISRIYCYFIDIKM